MKKIIFNFCLLVVALIMATGCEEQGIKFDSSKVIVGLSKTTLSVSENGTAKTFDIYVGGVTGTEPTDVTLAISVEGIAKPAVEGTDFTISSKSVNSSLGLTAVSITPINNEVFAGNKQFKVVISGNSKDYELTAQNTLTVTLVDDEHPLKTWIGTYTVAAVSYGSPGAWDEEWTVVSSAAGSDVTKLQFVGIGGGSEPVIATLNTTDMTIEIESGSFLGDDAEGGYTCSLYYATDEIIALAGDYITAAMLTASEAIKITGTIQANGTILIDKMAINLDDYTYCWDAFNTTWTK